jgi:hypothetical protein
MKWADRQNLIPRPRNIRHDDAWRLDKGNFSVTCPIQQRSQGLVSKRPLT